MVVNTIPYDADKEDTGTFWMVYIQGATATVVEHLSFESAMAEASRLCRKENKQVYVLEVNGLCIPGEPIWRNVKPSEAHTYSETHSHRPGEIHMHGLQMG